MKIDRIYKINKMRRKKINLVHLVNPVYFLKGTTGVNEFGPAPLFESKERKTHGQSFEPTSSRN
jgi:hypothetical protein